MRPIALVLAGLWLGALIASWVAASVNFRTVDRVLGEGLRPEVAAKLEPVRPEDRRMVLRHLASEINRWLFRNWSLAQLVLGALLLALVWNGGGAPRLLIAAALVVVILQRLEVGPIVDLGRSIDFVPRPLPPEIARRFGLLHATYVVSDLVKAALVAGAAWALARGSFPAA